MDLGDPNFAIGLLGRQFQQESDFSNDSVAIALVVKDCTFEKVAIRLTPRLQPSQIIVGAVNLEFHQFAYSLDFFRDMNSFWLLIQKLYCFVCSNNLLRFHLIEDPCLIQRVLSNHQPFHNQDALIFDHSHFCQLENYICPNQITFAFSCLMNFWANFLV